MIKYHPKKIESKWQAKWDKTGIFRAKNSSKKDKYYILVEFPYPSGDGLHVGHLRSYTAMDIVARKKRMQGKNVLYPIGWDAFGLPAENYALKTGIHPRISTEKNIKTFKKQCQMMGFSFDWDREISTITPDYYKWTQWIFLQFFKKNLAYQKTMPINWCPSCKTGLANEEVIDGKCERCGAAAELKEMKQWMLKITEYADRLIEDLDEVDFLEKIKIQQKNWIGKSEGADIDFSITDSREKIKVFTTRPDTLYGATYMVLAPEHKLINIFKNKIKNFSEVEEYILKAEKKSDLERTELQKEKTGVELKGVKAINPVNQKEIPIYIADYVLISYGSGAIMAVPAHDERDWEFAKKYEIEIIKVINNNQPNNECYIGSGKIVNSDEFNGMDWQEAKKAMTKKVKGKLAVNYKLRDWIFSR
ncbi:MAG: leucine--tRNA ligase, partial [Patescibacteria group bacterium]